VEAYSRTCLPRLQIKAKKRARSTWREISGEQGDYLKQKSGGDDEETQDKVILDIRNGYDGSSAAFQGQNRSSVTLQRLFRDGKKLKRGSKAANKGHDELYRRHPLRAVFSSLKKRG